MITEDVSPTAVADLASRRLKQGDAPLIALWVSTLGSRDQFAEAIRVKGPTRAIVPLIVRGVAFDDPNVLLQDLAVLLEQNQAEFADNATRKAIAALRRAAVVLIARVPLRTAQAASPITFPAWFPVCPGECHDVVVEDVSWRVEDNLSCLEVKAAQVAQGLYDLERAVIDRLRSVLESDHNHMSGFLSRVRGIAGEEITARGILEEADAAWHYISSPNDFRPSSKHPVSIVAMLWRIANETPPDQLSGVASHLAAALLAGDRFLTHEPLTAVLTRPSQPDSSAGVRSCRALVATVRAACQLTTAVAHADAYGLYPLLLLRALSYDLRVGLSEYANAVVDLPPPPPPRRRPT